MTIDLDQLERLAKESICVPDVPDGFLLPKDLEARNAFRGAANPAAILDLVSEVKKLRAYQRMARRQVYELMGVEVDIEQFGSGFDDVCMNTIKRVMRVLSDKEQA